MRKYAESWESMKKCAKSWESILEAEKVPYKLRKYEKVNLKLRKYKEVEPVAPPKQPVQVTQPLTNVEKVQSEPSATLAKPEAKNIRPNRQKKPIVRFVPNQNRYYEPEPEIKDNEPENED